MTTVHSSVIDGARDRTGNDPIFTLNAEARSRAAAGESILNATLGALMDDSGALCTMPTVLETFQRCAARIPSAGYPPIPGIPEFREAVIRDLFDGTSLGEQAVAVATPGGTGAVYAGVVNFLGPDEKLLVPEFYWGPYRHICDHAGRRVETFPMFDDRGAFDVDEMAAGLERHLVEQGRAMLILNFPCHNPTGYSLDAREWQEVVAAVNRTGARGPVTVMIDAAYMEFGREAARSWISAVPGLLRSATVLVAWTASKSLAQYGARIGALVALHRDEGERTQIRNALGYTCRGTWSNCNHLGQLAVTDLLTEPVLAERVAVERAGLSALLDERIDAFNEYASKAGIPTPRFDAGFFVAMFTPDQERTAAKMRELGVYTVPIPGAVRVAICATPASAMPWLVEALEAGASAGAAV